MQKTDIEWCKSPDGTPGFTWNPITGCLKGCTYCYARRIANGRVRERYLDAARLSEDAHGFAIVAPGITPADYENPFYPRFWPGRLDDLPLFRKSHNPRSRGIFVCDMADLFGPWNPREWVDKVFTRIEYNQFHRFYLLSKQYAEVVKYSQAHQGFPDNCWVGLTATNGEEMSKALVALNQVKATVKFLSLEPWKPQTEFVPVPVKGVVDWVIIGPQTKPFVHPGAENVKRVVDACDLAGVPVFLKDSFNGALPLMLGDKLMPFWRHDIMAVKVLRQEFPKVE